MNLRETYRLNQFRMKILHATKQKADIAFKFAMRASAKATAQDIFERENPEAVHAYGKKAYGYFRDAEVSFDKSRRLYDRLRKSEPDAERYQRALKHVMRAKEQRCIL